MDRVSRGKIDWSLVARLLLPTAILLPLALLPLLVAKVMDHLVSGSRVHFVPDKPAPMMEMPDQAAVALKQSEFKSGFHVPRGSVAELFTSDICAVECRVRLKTYVPIGFDLVGPEDSERFEIKESLGPLPKPFQLYRKEWKVGRREYLVYLAKTPGGDILDYQDVNLDGDSDPLPVGTP